METRELKHHPGIRMRSDAAIQLDKFEDDLGLITINRALVSVEAQRAVIRRWDIGGPANRPPNLYEPKRPPEASEHVQGIAFDTSHVTHCLRYAGAYGFYQRYSWDKPHFEFDPHRVRIRPHAESVKEIGIVEKLVWINGKWYALGWGKIKHLRDIAQYTDVKNVTGLPEVTLTDDRRLDAWSNLLDYYAIEPGVVNDDGYVRDPFTGTYPQGGAWSEERATRALLMQIARK
ncbi:endolysin, protease M15 domain [Microbacterium phage PineapplePizza]|uniref:Endolysin, protease M15 domain n=1 Tax=Microbacterium phage PineapplePizza TaxID=2927268 RepID=A0A976U7J4_9CAUD|nr:endolysin, protease M15 domain [Microbacterium phage PineapplePizza]UVF60421.1 endolysin, protease M15 domain [Microbacterium phage PineapplePizza]